jgi:phosphatidylserine/phosphatidylglycerophosphate/cardiolipin synthase-like enzyme
MTQTARRRICVATLAASFVFPPASFGFETSNVLPLTGNIEFAFTPGDDATGVITRVVDDARTQILVQAFSFTHRDIAAALIRAKRRGVDVQVLADLDQIDATEYTLIPNLAEAGVPVFTDSEHAAAHNKVMIVDTDDKIPVLILGSFNFTFSAQFRNAENLVALRGNNELNRAYVANWKRHLTHSRAFGGSPRQ